MSLLVLMAGLLIQDVAPHPSCCRRPRPEPVILAEPGNASRAVLNAVEHLCEVRITTTRWADEGRRDAAALGFAEEDGALVARPGGDVLTVVPASDGTACRIEGTLPWSDGEAAAFALLDWAEARSLSWTQRDRNGPEPDGGWYRRWDRGSAQEGRLAILLENGPRPSAEDQAPRTPARLEVRWTPPVR